MGVKKLYIILQLFVPHLSEEIWSEVGGRNVVSERWVGERKRQDEKKKVILQFRLMAKPEV